MNPQRQDEKKNDDGAPTILLFDLDGTLYDHACGYEEEIHSNIFKFMVEMSGGKFNTITTVDEAQRVWQPMFDKYNLTKRALIGEGYVFDSKYYDTFVRRGADKYFVKDDQLREFLESFPSEMKKVVFTNAPESSANEILNLLGVDDLFDHVLGTDFLDYGSICKPDPKAFTKVMNYLNVSPSEYHRVCYFEDSFKNLKAGKNLGFRTVFITSETLENEGKSKQELEEENFDAILHKNVNMTQLRSQLPQLWKE